MDAALAVQHLPHPEDVALALELLAVVLLCHPEDAAIADAAIAVALAVKHML